MEELEVTGYIAGDRKIDIIVSLLRKLQWKPNNNLINAVYSHNDCIIIHKEKNDQCHCRLTPLRV